jgi:hypothetical protein
MIARGAFALALAFTLASVLFGQAAHADSAASPHADAAASAGALPSPPPGKALVVFFRPAHFQGAFTWYKIRENGVSLGKMWGGKYIVQLAEPGPHTYTAATESRNTLHIELDDGETYYIRCSVQMGLLIDEPDMSPSDKATFEKESKHLRPASKTSPTDERAAPASPPK